MLPFLTEIMGTMPMTQVRRPRMSIDTILEARSIWSMMTDDDDELDSFNKTILSACPAATARTLLSIFGQRMSTGVIIERV